LPKATGNRQQAIIHAFLVIATTIWQLKFLIHSVYLIHGLPWGADITNNLSNLGATQ
jgi:hypothetical protein